MIRRLFSRMTRWFRGSSGVTVIGGSTVSYGSNIVYQMQQLIGRLSNFASLTEPEIYEQLVKWEPEIGGAVERFASLVRASYKGVHVKVGKTLDEEEERLQRLAQKVEQTLDVPKWFEIIAELMMIHGNAFIKVDWDNYLPTLTVLPNDRVTVVDSKSRIGKTDSTVITVPKYVVLNEMSMSDDVKIFKYGTEVMHFKYKDTPCYVEDLVGRTTYGIYSPSPLNRLVLPVLWKREIMLIDATWRWRNVPREHHVISSELFDLSRYAGSTLEEKRAAAESAAQQMIKAYMEEIKDKQPDQAYVTTDTIDIRIVEPKTSYADPNKLFEQITEYMLVALGVPESVVSGKSKGSYASELVISSYLTARVIQVAEKIKQQFLELIRETVRRIDPKLPVEKLDMKIELIMDTSKMELFRQAAIMAQLGVFTPSEIRKHLGYEPLTEGQWSEIVAAKGLRESRMGRLAGSKTLADILADIQKTLDDFDYPDTPHSEEARRGKGVSV